MRLRVPSLRDLASNWRLKLSALGLAILVWAVVSAEQPTSQWIPVTVEAQLRDPDFILAGRPTPAEVQVRFTGPGRELFELALDRPRLVVPVHEVGERRTFALDRQMVRLPPGLSVNAVEIRPASVRLDLQRLASRSLPVRPRIGPRSVQRYLIDEEVETLPAEVRVTGPAEILASLDFIATTPFELVPDDSVFSQEVPLDTAGLERLTFSRTRVRVSGTVEVRTERTVSGVAVYVPDGLVARPARVDARVQGGRRTLAAIFSPTLRAVVPRDSLPATIPPEGAEVPVVVEGLPPGTTGRATPLRIRVYPQGATPDAPPQEEPDTVPSAAPEPEG